MDLNWLNPTTVIAVVALYVAWSNYRRNNFPVVKLLESGCSYSQRAGENNDRMYGKFNVRVRNLGIPLHNVHMTLSFVPPDGMGRASLPLPLADGGNRREGQLAKGMVAEFLLKSHLLTGGDKHFLSMFHDACRQATSLCLYSDGYLAWEWRLDTRRYRLKQLWNRFAWKVNPKLTRAVKADGRERPVMKTYWLPTFILPDVGLVRFADDVRKADESQGG